MKVRIGNLEITVETLDELDELVKRYGNAPIASPDESAVRNLGDSRVGVVGASASDTVLLQRLVEAGDAGVTTIDVGNILGRRGKAARPALREWALRIRLTNDENIEPFEDARVGTQRGVRIIKSLQPVAEHILKQK